MKKPLLAKTWFSSIMPLLLVALTLGLLSSSAPAQAPKGFAMDLRFYTPPADKQNLPMSSCWRRPRNIILMIGDGMGEGQLDAARIRAMGSTGKLNIQRMPVSGFVTTHSSNTLVTDSAAAATALATGFKTNNGAIGVGGDETRFRTILEAARDKGMRTGVVATKSITDATPAGFYAHVTARGLESDIATQLLETQPDIALGGGKDFFLPRATKGSKRADDIDLVNRARLKGYTVVETADALKSASAQKHARVLGLFAPGAMKTHAPEPTVADMTQAAIKQLTSSRDRFFLMVEGSQIDTYAHSNVTTETLRQTLMFDQAVAVALDYAAKSKDTLVVVTADHITGGLTIENGDLNGANVQVKWDTFFHLGGQVPLYAYGPGAMRFTGFHDNTDIPCMFADLLRIRDFPSQSAPPPKQQPK